MTVKHTARGRPLPLSCVGVALTRIGGMIRAPFLSKKAGRRAVTLLFLVCAFSLASLFLLRCLHGTGRPSLFDGLASFRLFTPYKNNHYHQHHHLNDWGRAVSAGVNFWVRSAAYRDLTATEQAQRRAFYAEIEAAKQDFVKEHAVVATEDRVLAGARDPNQFRRDVRAREPALQRTVEAVIDGLFVTRPPTAPPLPRLQTLWRTHTPLELFAKYDTIDYVYSFVNGTEANYYYRKHLRLRCGSRIVQLEEDYFRGHTRTATQEQPSLHHAENTVPDTVTSSPPSQKEGQSILDALWVLCPAFRRLAGLQNSELLAKFGGASGVHALDERDRETDELRHSVRSVEQHVRWHKGRVIMVSPGHHPTWVNGAKNFLAGACGDAAVQSLRSHGTHLRLTTVHQDAVMPYGMRLTADSHVIEQHLWRVRNLTAVHVYMNDDYFVNRDVAITDLFNEYGGTIVRTESTRVERGIQADASISWAQSVAHTELFNIQQLEMLSEDFLPPSLAQSWSRLVSGEEKTKSWRRWLQSAKDKLKRFTRPYRDNATELAIAQEIKNVLTFRKLLRAANTSFYWEAALESPITPMSLPEGGHSGVITRYYATHAPFVYCTNMFRHFAVRFRGDMAPLHLRHRERRARDLLVPFLYNAYIMARPWEASAQFLPYVLHLSEAQAKATADTRASLHQLPSITAPYFHETLRALYQQNLAKYVDNVSVYLDNEDGCAPATVYRSPASEVLYMRAEDALDVNAQTMQRVARENPLYFNINAGFTTAAAAEQVREFLHTKFPAPLYLEMPTVDTGHEPSSANLLPSVFQRLMQLPVVGLVSYDEGICPLVRSLHLAFAGHHKGRVHLSVQHFTDDPAEMTLRWTRKLLNNRVVSALPATACAYGARVSLGAAPRGKSIVRLVQAVLRTVNVGVELPSSCGNGPGWQVRGFVIDARTAGAPVTSIRELREALAIPGQTLALEDFRAVPVGPGERDVVLVLSREDAAAKAVHWITGASENDLLVTYPLPSEDYEDLEAEVRWLQP